MSTRLALLKPTTLEIIILSVCPTILLLGTLFGIIDPSARKSLYDSSSQSHTESTAPSYFAKKNNIFNIFFVKRGWAWVTFSYFFFLFTHPFNGPTISLSLTPRRFHGLLRYSVVTLWWICVTQWFFGPPIIDRGFTITGGQCETSGLDLAMNANFHPTKMFTTAVACKAIGGQWKGGHDISGHVFLLVLGSIFLSEEVLHVSLARRREERIVATMDWAVKNEEVSSDVPFPRDMVGIWTAGSKLAIGVALMNLYMLAMTAAYFHTWFEKLTGLTVAFIGVFLVYFLPRINPALRSMLSLPGL